MDEDTPVAAGTRKRSKVLLRNGFKYQKKQATEQVYILEVPEKG